MHYHENDRLQQLKEAQAQMVVSAEAAQASRSIGAVRQEMQDCRAWWVHKHTSRLPLQVYGKFPFSCSLVTPVLRHVQP